MQNNYFYVDVVKEHIDINRLTQQILNSDTIDFNKLILVNCSPDYSSILVQKLNHNLSVKNNNELFKVINLEMPYPNSKEVLLNNTPIDYIEYCRIWKYENYNKDAQFLFIDSGCLRGNNFTILKNTIGYNKKNIFFTTLYLQENSIFTPDFYVQKFSNVTTKGLLFWWENINNPNWNY